VCVCMYVLLHCLILSIISPVCVCVPSISLLLLSNLIHSRTRAAWNVFFLPTPLILLQSFTCRWVVCEKGRHSEAMARMLNVVCSSFSVYPFGYYMCFPSISLLASLNPDTLLSLSLDPPHTHTHTLAQGFANQGGATRSLRD
jgi:hypothetical protein